MAVYLRVGGKEAWLAWEPSRLRSLDWPRATAPGAPTWPNHRFLLPFYIGNNVGNNNVRTVECGMIELKLVYNRLQMWFEFVIAFMFCCE